MSEETVVDDTEPAGAVAVVVDEAEEERKAIERAMAKAAEKAAEQKRLFTPGVELELPPNAPPKSDDPKLVEKPMKLMMRLSQEAVQLSSNGTKLGVSLVKGVTEIHGILAAAIQQRVIEDAVDEKDVLEVFGQPFGGVPENGRAKTILEVYIESAERLSKVLLNTANAMGKFRTASRPYEIPQAEYLDPPNEIEAERIRAKYALPEKQIPTEVQK